MLFFSATAPHAIYPYSHTLSLHDALPICPQAGVVGYFAPDGNMDSCIVLRTAIVKDGEMHVQAGAGIVADSDPLYEQRECEAKAGALFAAAREAVRLRSEEHTSELQSLMRNSYAVFCLKKKKHTTQPQ